MKQNLLKLWLRKLNSALEGFRGLIAIWVPILAAYFDVAVAGLTAFNRDGVMLAAQLAIVPTVKLIYTDAIPKMKILYLEWLNK